MSVAMVELIWRPESRTPSLEDSHVAERRLQVLGLRCFDLEVAGSGPAARRALYDLVRTGVLDASHGDDDLVPYETFDRELFGPYYWRWPKEQIIVRDSEQWVGVANLQPRSPGRAEMGITVVREAYRRRGIGRALKVIALARARYLGVASVVTRNRADNTAILQLNASLGFVPVER